MNKIICIIKKELLDTLRDKRTLMTTIVVPTVIIPVILLIVVILGMGLVEEERNKQLNIALIDAPNQVKAYFVDDKINLKEEVDITKAQQSILSETLDAAIVFNEDFLAKVGRIEPVEVSIYYKSTNRLLYGRLLEKMEHIKHDILSRRLKKMQLPPNAFVPITIVEKDIAPPKEKIGKTIGGFLPYIFIIFCFMGCMYPAIDLIAGEKERGTMETLLTVPVSRFNILLGKTIAIALVGLLSTLMVVTGFAVELTVFPQIPPEIKVAIQSILNINVVTLTLLMLFPLSFFFANALAALVVRAHSFKEAQSMVTPLTILVILPAMMALLPGIELNWKTVWVPVLNVALATKEIIAGTLLWSHYLTILVSLCIIAVLAAYVSFKQFSKEHLVLS